MMRATRPIRPVRSLGLLFAVCSVGFTLEACGKKETPQTYSPFPKETITTEATFGIVDEIIVSRGDNLATLAGRCYGNSSKWKDLAEWNNKAVPYLVQIGERIQLREPCTLNKTEGEIAVLKVWRSRMGLPNEGQQFEHAKALLLSALEGRPKVAPAPPEKEIAIAPVKEPVESALGVGEEHSALEPSEPVPPVRQMASVTPAEPPSKAYFTEAQIDRSVELLEGQKFAEAFDLYWNTPRIFSDEAKRRGIVFLEGDPAERLFAGMTGVKTLPGKRTAMRVGDRLKLEDVPRKQGERMVCARIPKRDLAGRGLATGQNGRSRPTTAICLGVSSN